LNLVLLTTVTQQVMHQYNLLYFANYSTLSNVHSTELAIFTCIFTNVRDDDGNYGQWPVPTAYYLRRRRRLCFWFGLFVCLSICLFVCLSVGLLANLWTDF